MIAQIQMTVEGKKDGGAKDNTQKKKKDKKPAPRAAK